jgi:Pregnancy-associated plasma protein-A
MKMKKTLKLFAIAMLTYSVISCTDESVNKNEPISKSKDSQAKESAEGRKCAANDVLEENLKEDPSLRDKMKEVEDFTEKFIKANKKGRVGVDEVLIIPVVVNIIYNTAQQNISQAQVQSQIDVLNRDFRFTNTDKSLIPSVFTGSDLKIEFSLVATNRKPSSKTSWGTRDAMKSSKKGGIDPTSPTTTLNIWVCNIGGGILGYAQFPGGNVNTDGVVIGPNYFGNTGYVSAPYNKGRTATHEIGHWLNLRHIWGDASCGNDQVGDTPTQQTANYGCPTFPHVTCGNGPNGDQFMNYMDYTDDACMYMFTGGQKDRSRALFAAGGVRAAFNP